MGDGFATQAPIRFATSQLEKGKAMAREIFKRIEKRKAAEAPSFLVPCSPLPLTVNL